MTYYCDACGGEVPDHVAEAAIAVDQWRRAKCPHCHKRTVRYEPSPEEIRADCERIQQTWTASEEQRRSSQSAEPLDVIRVRTHKVRRGWRWVEEV